MREDKTDRGYSETLYGSQFFQIHIFLYIIGSPSNLLNSDLKKSVIFQIPTSCFYIIRLLRVIANDRYKAQ